MNRKLLVLPALLGALAPVVTGCGSSGGGSGGGKPIVVGSTDSIELNKDNPAPLDPAAEYDADTWQVFYNTFQELLAYPRGSTTPSPDAAKECHYADSSGLVYQCTLRSGMEFSNGHPMTSQDVKFSVERVISLKATAGPSSLLSDVKSVETPSASVVVFHLKAADATFPAKLATPAAAIVDHQVYSATKTLTGWRVVGSGPYVLNSYSQDKQAVFTKNPHYKGIYKINNSAVTMKLYGDSNKMEDALKSGQLDVMTRELAPDQIQALQDNPPSGVKLTQVAGGESRYLFLNTKDGSLKNLAVRQAIAQLIDRQEITRDIYKRTDVPLYSIVPQGTTAHVNSFFDKYGDPSTSKARSILQKAGFTDKVPLTINFRRDLGGTAYKAEAQMIAKQLDASGLFDVKTEAEQWNVFLQAAAAGKYQVFAVDWLPDFPDPDNYVAPFLDKETFIPLPYQNKEIQDTILPETRQEAARSATADAFERAQQIVADDVPMIPLWQGNQYIVSRSDITGVEWAQSSTGTTQFWELGRGASE
ncbi:ABC transporter substrate-binding protein [Actinacidiphila yeochonensis]|uniref:ABC transporter substrate-binding protein n=1 Tax=Actinacidiphila yeochonensis TaxID=89050 RepID=UPI0005685078|nr:ABC transporter substrate-binding protein [Actinacidiphila yeochonensis]